VPEPTFAELAPRCRVLALLEPATLGRLAAGAHRVAYERGRVLFIDAEMPDAVYVVVRGLVRIFKTELDGAETTVRVVGDAQLFGELAVADGGRRTASAITLRPTIAYRVPAALLEAELPPKGTVARALLTTLVDLLRTNTASLAVERSQRLESAVARALTDDPDVLRRISQGELASLLGVSRQSVNQTLRSWEREGLIERTEGHMRLTGLDTIRQRYLVG
jgi:CRP/FNR family transcriptional regulator, cyclic AMP receptor protein